MRLLLAATAISCLSLPVAAQQTQGKATEAPPAPKVVVVQAGAGSRPTPVKIVRVAPAPRQAPAGAYEGSRSQKNWAFYSSGGVARSRANYAIWRTRFRPTSPYRSVTRVYRAFGSGWGGTYSHGRFGRSSYNPSWGRSGFRR